MYKVLLAFALFIGIGFLARELRTEDAGGAPPGGASREEVPSIWNGFRGWKRPEGPARVGIQVGHWKNEEFPEELSKLRGNTGASAGGYAEWEVNLMITEKIAEILEENQVKVDILPATVPPEYWADAFVSIHADGSEDSRKSGFKIAPPWRDFSGDAEALANDIREIYLDRTGLLWDENITRNMRGYYAFSWWRYEHAIHPMTTAVIVETGFLSNPDDRALLTENPEVPADAIAEGLLEYLQNEGLL